jgi:hypothetical protein
MSAWEECIRLYEINPGLSGSVIGLTYAQLSLPLTIQPCAGFIQPGREADHSSPSGVEANNTRALPPLPIGLHRMMLDSLRHGNFAFCLLRNNACITVDWYAGSVKEE